MKVLFAVSNDNVSSSIIKRYQQKYKEIITSKNVYYFNAIIKELQKDKSYDVVVIGEDLEPISTTNYDTMDNFIFDKLDSISDEAAENTPIILICSDRRTKSDKLLIRLFGIGVYNALIGNDRNIDAVCTLINKPRSKKEAKGYYRVDSDDVNYRPVSEAEVSETEIQNILAHYKKIGNNQRKCIESFNSIASQYTDTQLRIIIKFLPNNVKSILETGSDKYQKLVNGGTVLTGGTYQPYSPQTSKDIKKQGGELFTKDLEKSKLTEPVIIPSTMNISNIPSTQNNSRMSQPVNNNNFSYMSENSGINNQQFENLGSIQNTKNNEYNDFTTNMYNPSDLGNNQSLNNNLDTDLEKKINNIEPNSESEFSTVQAEPVSVPKRRGRPKKVISEEIKQEPTVQPVKRGRGRPKKVVPQENSINQEPLKQENLKQNEDITSNNDTINLFGLDENITDNSNVSLQDNIQEQDINLFDIGNDVETTQNVKNNDGNGYAENDYFNPYMMGDNDIVSQNNDIYNQGEMNKQNTNEKLNEKNFNQVTEPYQNVYNNNYQTEEITKVSTKNNVIKESNFIAQNSKLISFVGTSKNGTSFIVNNLAELLSKKGISTAILDLTKNKNSYYMFTDNDETLMAKAGNSIKNLAKGSVEGVQVNKNLMVFTSLPGDDYELENIDMILQTLDNNFSAVLMDCDFDTDINYFVKSTETYLVQTMDALTIQPLTQFLSELKLKNALDETKLRIIINKEVKLKLLSNKMIIGGMAKYNEPNMSLQRDLFDANTIRYVTIPFEEQTYARYLEAIALCQISLNGYSARFMNSLEELANMVYPLVPGGGNQGYSDYSKYSPNYEKAKRGGLFGGRKKQAPTEFSSGVNSTLNKMRSNY